MPELPDPHAIAVMVLTLGALVLFAQERVPLETSSLLVLVVLVLGFQLYPYSGPGGEVSTRDLFAGFGHEALIAVCALMMLGKGIETTGALQPVARVLARMWKIAPAISLFFTLVLAAALSAVINNTPIVVILLPILVGVMLGAKSSPSGVLMPFGLATIIGGSITTIGTSTNLLVVSVARDLGVRPFAMFDFALPLAIVGLGGIVFLWLVAPRLLPKRASPISDRTERVYSAVLYVEEDSKIAGKTLAEARKIAGGHLRLMDVRRGKGVTLSRLPTLTLVAGDRLHVVDTPDRLKELESLFGAAMHDLELDPEEAAKEARKKESNEAPAVAEPDQAAKPPPSKPSTVPTHADADAETLRKAEKKVARRVAAAAAAEERAEDGTAKEAEVAKEAKEEEKPVAAKAPPQQRLIEVVVTEDSPLNNSTVKLARVADEYGMFVLAIHRGQMQHEVRRNELGDVMLRTGDVLLMQGEVTDIGRLKSDPRFLVLDSVVDLPDTKRAPLALGIMAGVVVAAAAGLIPIGVAALGGIVLMLVTGCLNWQQAVKGLSVQVVMIIVTSLALGTALITTGGADYVARLFVVASAGLSPTMMLAGLMLLMAGMTNILSNNAAGIIGTPIAIGIAKQLSLAPEPFVVAIIAGVNLSFATPMAYQTNLLVMHAGGYRFMDFVRVGVPLMLLMLAGYAVVIPRFFPF
ncbi:MAG TPA: SLC13 family permease [Burkholderiales bacterium]